MGEPVRKFGCVWVVLDKVMAEGIEMGMGYVGRFEQHSLLDCGQRCRELTTYLSRWDATRAWS